MLGMLALLNHLTKIERFHPEGFNVAFATQLAFLVLLPRFFYVLWRGTSRAFAWCSSAFFFLLAVATVATSSTAYSWSFLRYVELWGGAVIAAARLRADQARLLLWLFVLLAIGVAILGVAQHFGLTPAGPFPVGAYTRASATFGQPNPFGGFVAMAVAAAFGLLLRTRATEAKIACASLFLLSLGLFASLSRGAIAACIAALLVLSMFARRLDSSVATIGIGLALVLAWRDGVFRSVPLP
jgi:hypothetical protein